MAQKEKTMRTVDHQDIRDWAEARGGTPAVVADTRDMNGGGVLRIDFGADDEQLEKISWEEFFRLFDGNDLAFVYQEVEDDGELSYFCKFAARSEDEDM